MEAWTKPHHRVRTYALLVLCGVFALAAGLVGVGDNPVGIFLAWSAGLALILAFVHPWRTAKPYRRLLYASVLGFILFAVLHNVFYALSGTMIEAETRPPQNLLEVLSVAAFLLAILICIPAALLGLVGSVVMFIRNRRRPA